MRRFGLRSLRFGEADEAWCGLPVDVDPFSFGGLDYEVEDGVVDLSLNASRVGARITLDGRVDAVVQGPCQRCLGPARVLVRAHGMEVSHGGRLEGDGEGDAPYVEGGVLAADRWVRDLLADELPEQLLCRPDCRGLCPQCGADLNVVGDEHGH